MSLSDRFKNSGNPMLSEDRMAKAAQQPLDGGFITRADADVMTIGGTVNKTFLLGALVLVTSVYSFFYPSSLFMWGGAIGGLALVFAMSFKPKLSGTLAPIYALLEGLFLGSVTAIYVAGYGPAIAFNAIMITIALLFAMLFSYKAGLIKVTEKFRTGVIMATGGIALVYLISIGLSFFGIQVPYLHQGGMIGIGISLFIIGIATLNLLLDFDNIERGAAMRSPKYMEWFCAMGLIVTLVWLYIEVLRLLSVLNRD